MASLVATMGGDWTQTVCERCYGFLVHEQRENAKKAPSTERRPAQAKQPPPHVNPGRPPKGKLPQPVGKKKRQQLEKESRQLQRQLPGLDSLPTFFPAANVHAELWQGRCVQINGRKTEPLGHLPPPETLEWSRIINEMVLKYLRGNFITAVEKNARFGDGLSVVLRSREGGFLVTRDDVRLAVI